MPATVPISRDRLPSETTLGRKVDIRLISSARWVEQGSLTKFRSLSRIPTDTAGMPPQMAAPASNEEGFSDPRVVGFDDPPR